MGAWGYGIWQDDFVQDVRSDLVDLLKEGHSVSEATREVEKRNTSVLGDTDNEPLLWLAIADFQWTFGTLEPRVLDRIRKDFESGAGLDLWEEQGSKSLEKRKKVLQKFLDKISAPNPKPRRAPKIVVRPPLFAVGDCLSVQLANGLYGAAYVPAVDHSRAEYGMSLVAALDYLGPDEPSLDVFRKRRWLLRKSADGKSRIEMTWVLSIAYKKYLLQFKRIGSLPRKWTDPKDVNSYGSLLAFLNCIEFLHSNSE